MRHLKGTNQNISDLMVQFAKSPLPPYFTPTFSIDMSNPVFGKALRKDFCFEPGYIPLGHGSFGAIPNVVKQKLREYQDKSEAHPDRWNRFEMIPVIEKNLVLLSKLMNCDSRDINFVSNSSEAASVILRSYPFKAGDKVLCVSLQSQS